MTTAHTALAQHRITQLASRLPTHRAFHWLHLHQPQVLSWQMEFTAIPAPPFAERARAEWFAEKFRALGLAHVHLDDEGNVLGELGSGPAPAGGPVLLLSAHLDTVFPAGTETIPRLDGQRVLAPGICDNGAGLAGLLAIVAALRYASIEPAVTILFAANVGEEGEGDLRGMRHLFLRGPYRGRIAAALALEGAGTGAAVTRALGSRRFRVTVTGPGGHSWTDAGAPNPILLISHALVHLAGLPGLRPGAEPRTTFSAGCIAGGTSVNSIPASATVDLDLRSADPDELTHHVAAIHRAFEHVVAATGAGLTIIPIGDRPAGALPEDAPLLETLRAVDRHLGLRTEQRLGSTDANLPLSLGIPAMALASGGTCGGVHTLAEWYDPGGRETALRRILLTVLDLARTAGDTLVQ